MGRQKVASRERAFWTNLVKAIVAPTVRAKDFGEMFNDYLTDMSFNADDKTENQGFEREHALWASLVEAVVGPSEPDPIVQLNADDNVIYASMSGTSRRKFSN